MLRKKLKMSADHAQDVDEKGDGGSCPNPIESEADKTKHESDKELKFSVVFEVEFWEKIWKLEQELAAELLKIEFKNDKNIAAIYNPLDYAADVHTNFMRMYLKKAPSILFLGMNPGLFGMCQTSASVLKTSHSFD